MTREANVKAVCLLSGGLDSSLALKIVQAQGIEVIAVHCKGPFGGCTEVRDSAASAVATALGVRLVVIQLEEDYLDIVRSPRFGYGSNINPCIDCHIYFLKQAGRMMTEEGASFVITGEVVGQRPMSQRLDTLRRIEKASGLIGLILRPLSARLLDETIPEVRGWVRRDELLAISGRSRREQLRLADDLGLKGFSAPAGGCLLTDPQFAGRVRDLIAHGSLNLYEASLLRVGRHLRLPLGSKLVVGRNETENHDLEARVRAGDFLLVTEDCPGPTAILSGGSAGRELELAAGIVARYSDGKRGQRVIVRVSCEGRDQVLTTVPLDSESTRKLMV
jgi:tRNA-uridine 2-sulfurtransferase